MNQRKVKKRRKRKERKKGSRKRERKRGAYEWQPPFACMVFIMYFLKLPLDQKIPYYIYKILFYLYKCYLLLLLCSKSKGKNMSRKQAITFPNAMTAHLKRRSGHTTYFTVNNRYRFYSLKNMFTLSNVRTSNMTWITETMWNLKWILFGSWRSLKWCQRHNRVSLVFFLAISSGGLKVHWVHTKTMARWFLTAKLEWRARDARRKKQRWIESQAVRSVDESVIYYRLLKGDRIFFPGIFPIVWCLSRWGMAMY